MKIYTVEYNVDLGTHIIGAFSDITKRESFLKQYKISIPSPDYIIDEYNLDDFITHVPNHLRKGK